MAVLLEASGITKRFGGLIALNAVNFELEEGRIASIIGPSTGVGWRNRPIASISTTSEMPTSVAPLTSAARISARKKPKVRVGVGVRRANHIANSVSPSAAASDSMWPASASSASEPDASPPATSAAA